VASLCMYVRFRWQLLQTTSHFAASSRILSFPARPTIWLTT